MKVLVPVKRVIDYNVKARGFRLFNVRLGRKPHERAFRHRHDLGKGAVDLLDEDTGVDAQRLVTCQATAAAPSGIIKIQKITRSPGRKVVWGPVSSTSPTLSTRMTSDRSWVMPASDRAFEVRSGLSLRQTTAPEHRFWAGWRIDSRQARPGRSAFMQHNGFRLFPSGRLRQYIVLQYVNQSYYILTLHDYKAPHIPNNDIMFSEIAE